MIDTRALPLDCALLSAPADVRLSGADLRRIEPLQHVLLRPLEYDSVDAWRSAVNRAAIAALGGDSAMFQFELPGAALHHSDEVDLGALTDYESEFMPELARTRQLYQRMRRFGSGNRSILWRDDLEWFYGSDYFNELVAKQRAFDSLWACVPDEGSRYPSVLHTYHDRRQGGRRFDAADVQLMRLIRPALEAGVQTVRRVFESRLSLGRGIDRLDAAVFAFELDGHLLHRNPRASALAEQAGGEALCVAAVTLARGLARESALVESAPVRRVTTPSGEYDLSASLLSPGVLHVSAVALVTVAERSERLPTRTEVQERFGLTPRQAEVALLLAGGLTNPEIANRLVISPHTALRHTETVRGKLKISDRRLVAERLRGRAEG